MLEIEDRKTRLARKAARREAKRQQNAQLIAMVDEGLTSSQIAARLSISVQAVRERAANIGFSVGTQGGNSRMHCWLKPATRAVISAVAEGAGISPAAQVSRALNILFADEATAKRFLGKAAIAKRAYRSR